ncbi:cellulase family glycosylhydrolase [Alkalihalobacillus pseudalcaliphilus]|uniref:cellulase family glycosylhydrolase n=1 Tax=Alkalihalobacillus pseudalcaliphilus TaxID=79884 RepID=UPI00064E13A2|nr:cellulase family glycosylhydrolase [Alkalihalobacillus pseudalcaliphilus]KMK75227.1 hypothetical protein AB990_17505 [Alkalihalobacillus pseudalcaliphilus]
MELLKRRRFQTFYIVIAFFGVSLFFFVSTGEASKQEGPLYDINEYVQDMQPGWNLGNSFDAVGDDETAWGNPFVTKKLIEEIAEQGFKSIRIPITFDQRMELGPDYLIDEDFLSRVTQVVNWSLEEDLFVMINVHHDSWLWLEEGMYNENQQSLERFEAIWLQLGDHFKDYPIELMFESINEPRFYGQEQEKQAFLDQLNDSFFDIVRNSGALNEVRPLVLPTLDASPDHQNQLEDLYEKIEQLDDPYLIGTVHFYGFWPFSVNVAGYTHFEQDSIQHIHETFDRVEQTLLDRGIPVVLGEYGLLGFDTHTGVVQQGEKLKFFEYMIHYVQEKGIAHMLWDNGQHFNRTNYEWADGELFEMMKASWEGRSATASANYLYVDKDEEILDHEFQLQLNGRILEEIRLDGALLNEHDYTIEGETLTIKASIIKEVVKDFNSVGEKGVFTIAFDHGSDWYIKVYAYHTPIIGEAEGNVDDFTIPIEFNGSHLKTMEAVYPDGSPAGPHDWTTFKEFGYAFSPNYEDNELTFPYGRFFNELEDGETELTFYFWSGEQLDYTLQKNGEHVIGFLSLDKEEEQKEQEEQIEEETDIEKEKEISKPKENGEGPPAKGKDDKEEERGTDEENGEKNEGALGIEAGGMNPPPNGEKTSEHGNHLLPDTATNSYNFLLLGSLFILLSLLMKRVRTKNQPVSI